MPYRLLMTGTSLIAASLRVLATGGIQGEQRSCLKGCLLGVGEHFGMQHFGQKPWRTQMK